MKDYEIIARAKEILLERGSNKGTYENENGQVCILGAFAYAYDEKTGDHLSDFEVGEGGYFDDIISLPQMRNLQDEIQEIGNENVWGEHVGLLSRGIATFNDSSLVKFEDDMNLLNVAEIASKEADR